MLRISLLFILCSGRLILNFYKIVQKHYLMVNLSKPRAKDLSDLSFNWQISHLIVGIADGGGRDDLSQLLVLFTLNSVHSPKDYF